MAVLRYDSDVLGAGIYICHQDAEINGIPNLVARTLARMVAKDEVPRRRGMWTAWVGEEDEKWPDPHGEIMEVSMRALRLAAREQG